MSYRRGKPPTAKGRCVNCSRERPIRFSDGLCKRCRHDANKVLTPPEEEPTI